MQPNECEPVPPGGWGGVPPAVAAALAAALLCACTTTPLAPIPDALPETLAWARPADAAEGAFLGLKTRENDSGTLDDLSFDPGVRVTRVVEGSPAAQAGLRVDDVVLAMNGREVDDPGALDALVAAAEASAEVELRVQRGDSVFRVPARLRPAAASMRAEVELVSRLDPARSRAGWLTGRGGVVLVSSAERGPFPRAGIPVGSVVRALDGRPVASDRELIRRLQAREPGSAVEVAFVDAGGDARTAEVELFRAPRRLTGLKFPILLDYEADPDGGRTSFELVDLLLISLFRYQRQGAERHYRILGLLRFATGVGELAG